MNTAEVELCGPPKLRLMPTSVVAELMFHSTDPDCHVHAELALYLNCRTGRFYFYRTWLI